MPRRPSLEAKDTGTPKGFVVHVPASMSHGGKLERRYFKDKGDADAFAAKLRTAYHKGIRGGVVDAGTAHGASVAEKALRDARLPVTLIEAVRGYIDARAVLDPLGISLGEACKSWQTKYKASRAGQTFGQAAAAFIAEKETTWSDRYARNIDQTLKAVPKWLAALPLAEIDDEVLLKATRESVTTPTAIETRMRHLKSLVSGKGKKKKSTPPALLSIRQAAAMLRACETPEERRAVALLLFAGIRPDSEHGEIAKLDWSAVKGGRIHVDHEVSKTGTDRIIEIRPRLARLIKGHPADGPVMPPSWKKRITIIRKAAGMNDPKFQDATRHCFASHHLVAFGEAATQAAMGHTEGSRTLFKHYRRAITEAAGTKYFQ
jgi:integrase